MSDSPPLFSNREIVAARGAKNNVDPQRPYAFFVETECNPRGIAEPVATIFLTNRECPFRCLMCDLWKNTLDDPTPKGATPEQIDYALARLDPAQRVKLYNSGNFFDPQAVPVDDWPAIAKQVEKFDAVIVENHPRFCTDRCWQFRDLLSGELEIAIGLETSHAKTLQRLNKQMTRDDFRRAVGQLVEWEIRVRTFILLGAPFQSASEGLEWAIRSIEFAFDAGVECCAIIPTRSEDGLMPQLLQNGDITPPALSALETALEAGLQMGRGRVFADLWDVERLAACPRCKEQRHERLRRMNLSQQLEPQTDCVCKDNKPARQG